jgi:GNAT superfamily N-acetyltransferase
MVKSILTMEIINSDSLTKDQKRQILNLWNNEYPKDLSLAGVDGFDAYLEKLSDKHHLLIVNQDEVEGWLIYFIRDGERCFAMLLDPRVQGKGLGRALLEKAKQYNAVLVGWVIKGNDHLKNDGSFYKSPVDFYEKAGFKILADVITEKNGIKGIQVRWEA